MSSTRAALVALLGGVASGCGEPVPYTVNWSELVLLPPDTAVAYLQSLPASAPALSLRPDLEHCEFQPNGLRVAAANPQAAQRVVDGLRAEARRVAAEKGLAERELRRIEGTQRDRTRWMRLNGYAQLADEQRRLEEEHRDPARWLKLRGFTADQAYRAERGIENERADLAGRLRAVDEAMVRERQAAVARLRAIEDRERRLERSINDTHGRVHETVPYDRVAFVVYRRMSGEMELDVRYALQDTVIEGCGFRLDPAHRETPATIRKIATALSALGAEGQAGIVAEPRIGSGRRYSARPDPSLQVTTVPGVSDSPDTSSATTSASPPPSSSPSASSSSSPSD